MARTEEEKERETTRSNRDSLLLKQLAGFSSTFQHALWSRPSMSSRWSGFRDAMDVVQESAMLHNHKKSSRGQFCRSWRSRVWTFLFFRFLEDAVLFDVLVRGSGRDSPKTTRSYLSGDEHDNIERMVAVSDGSLYAMWRRREKRMWSVQNIEPVKLSALAEARALRVRWESVDEPLDSQTRP